VRVCGDANGTLTVESQAELDELSACEVIEGQLSIQAPDVTNLSPLAALRLVTDEFSIYGATALESLAGLTQLEHVGSLAFLQNDALTDLRGLETLRTIGGGVQVNRIAIDTNPKLGRISELSGASASVESVEIFGNPELTSLDGLPRVTSLRYLVVTATAVENLSAFSSLVECDDLAIEGNSALTTLALDDLAASTQLIVSSNTVLDRLSIPSLSTGGNVVVQGNTALREITFETLRTVDRLVIDGNPALTSLAGFDTLESANEMEIYGNASLPQCLVDELDARLQACLPRACEFNDATAACD
jgi:hypothetical protein